jgi:hypothetical protein
MSDLHDAPRDGVDLDAELERALDRLIVAAARSGPISYEAQHRELVGEGVSS